MLGLLFQLGLIFGEKISSAELAELIKIRHPKIDYRLKCNQITTFIEEV